MGEATLAMLALDGDLLPGFDSNAALKVEEAVGRMRKTVAEAFRVQVR